MIPGPNTFELRYGQHKMRVDRVEAAGQVLYRAIYPLAKPLILARAKDSNDHYFWTSIPDGRLKEAQEIGKLIEEHLKLP
jgi:hypothetical protein